jgi:hypothetical protein
MIAPILLGMPMLAIFADLLSIIAWAQKLPIGTKIDVF